MVSKLILLALFITTLIVASLQEVADHENPEVYLYQPVELEPSGDQADAAVRDERGPWSRRKTTTPKSRRRKKTTTTTTTEEPSAEEVTSEEPPTDIIEETDGSGEESKEKQEEKKKKNLKGFGRGLNADNGVTGTSCKVDKDCGAEHTCERTVIKDENGKAKKSEEKKCV